MILGVQTVQGPQTSESLNLEISTFQLELRVDTLCADEQDVFTKVNADFERVFFFFHLCEGQLGHGCKRGHCC